MFNRLFVLSLVLVVFGLGCGTKSDAGSNARLEVRKAAVAGQFYPDDAEKLRLAINNFMSNRSFLKQYWPIPSGKSIEYHNSHQDVFPLEIVDQPLALIVPHAGYVYSGQIAADAFGMASKSKYDVIIVIGTNHTTAGFDGISIYAKGAFETPLGQVAIDEVIAEQILDADKEFTFNREVHKREHSIEVQLPFIQVLFPNTKIVPIVIGLPDLRRCQRLGKVLVNIAKQKRILIVASSDLSHYPNYEDACKVDKGTMESIVSLDGEKLQNTIQKQMHSGIANLSTCACGEGPILTVMAAANELGIRFRDMVSYANSGNCLIGDRNRVVGYGAIVMSKREGVVCLPPKFTDQIENQSMEELESTDKQALLKFARQCITQYLTTQITPLPRGFSTAADQKLGAFVTLTKHGELRGCIGHMSQDLPLKQVVGMMALHAALNDHRFSPVTADELKDIEIEISVLTPTKPVKGYEDIVVGRDGVALEKSGYSAVFLPQVAPEQGWTRDEMLEHLSMKAGLSRDAWRKGAKFSTFQAIVFNEGEFK